MIWTVLAIARAAFKEDRLRDVMSRTSIRPEIFQYVRGLRPLPKMMMRIHDGPLGIDDVFLHLVQPFVATGFELSLVSSVATLVSISFTPSVASLVSDLDIRYSNF